jgi:hypothetical protein
MGVWIRLLRLVLREFLRPAFSGLVEFPSSCYGGAMADMFANLIDDLIELFAVEA